MNSDIRILITFRNNRKRRKLDMLLGENSAGYLVDLWIGTAISRPDGILTEWDATDIALEANYQGPPEKFLSAMKESRFIDEDDSGVLSLHNWKNRQKWAANDKDRSVSASKKALRRWTLNQLAKKDHADFNAWFDTLYEHSIENNAASILLAYKQHTNGNATSIDLDTVGNAPSPSPSPLPKDIKDFPLTDKKNGKEYKSKKSRTLSGETLLRFLDFWAAFSYPKGKAEAADAWLDVYNPEEFETIVEAAKIEAAGRQGIIDRGGTPKFAQGWLSGRRWEDGAVLCGADKCQKCTYEAQKVCHKNEDLRKTCTAFRPRTDI